MAKRRNGDPTEVIRGGYVGDIATTDMMIERYANGDVVIKGIDPDNMGRLSQNAIRMSATEWDTLVSKFARLAKDI